ncbi:MAG: ABC transporter substrate-binding protein [Firmicutes bacterium]|nr:ABC transporter substrate-binding protein [Bacillota bacterium]MCL5038251.1 ABC transporter substrate-binding protein [Bacillota bacterium]
MKKVLIGVLILLMTGLTLVGCGGSGGSKDTGGAPKTGPAGQVVVAQGVDATTMDPAMHAETPTGNIQRNIFDSLIFRNKDMKLEPGLALSWKALDDRHWEIVLRQGVKFHDGTPLTAKDVKFTLDRIINPDQKSPRRSNLEAIDKVEIVDDYKLTVTTKAPYPILPGRLADELIVPADYVKKVGDAEFAKNPIGTGPYKFIKWVKDDQVVLEANTNYWKGAPTIKTVIFRPIPETSTRIAELQTGAVDIIVNVPPDQVKTLESGTNTRVSTAPSSRVIFIGFVANKGGPLANAKVRQAINYAVDVDSIIKNILLGNGYRVASPLTKAHFGYDPDVKPYTFDPGKAKELLKEAGYPNGVELTMDSPNGRYLMDKEIAEAVVGQLAQVGIKVKLNVLEWGVYVKKIMAKELTGMYLLGWGNSTFDADGTLYPLLRTGQRFSYYENPKLDKLLDEARSTIDEQKRLADYHEAVKIINQDAAWLFLHQQRDIYGASKRIEWEARPDELLWLYDAKLK